VIDAGQKVCLMPGQNNLSARLELERPRYTRYEIRFRQDRETRSVGVVTLRAAAEDVPELPHLKHPYLFFGDRELTELRRKGMAPAFAYIWAAMAPREEDLNGDGLPESSAETSFALADDNHDVQSLGRVWRCFQQCPVPVGIGGPFPQIVFRMAIVRA